MTPSPQQAAVIDWVANGAGSAFVEAVAGAGKTTTLINALAGTEGSVAFAAYNTKIAAEIKAKVAKLELNNNRIRVGTFHSFGLGGWKRAYPEVKFGPEAAREKYDISIAKLVENKVPEAIHLMTMKLVGLAKQGAVGLFGEIDDDSLWYRIIDHHDLAYEIEDDEEGTLVKQAVQFAQRTLKWHRALAPKIVDFDDMIYQPVVSGIRLWQNDWVFVDEAQDTNPARRALARKMLRPQGRACFVGDRHQAIYGFTGADSDAIDHIMHDFNCATLPMITTYRCPKAVVAEAQKIVSHIEAADTAPEGTVSYADYGQITKAPCKYCGTGPCENCMNSGYMEPQYELSVADAILCRLTKPLVQTAYALIKQGVACHVEGRDIGAGLLKLVDRYKAKSLQALRAKLEAFRERETQKLVAKGRETQAETLRDRVDTIFVMMEGLPGHEPVALLRNKIREMFVDGDDEAKPTLTLATVHRSKGREWQRVFVLGYSAYMPSPFARQDWQLAQERNLQYVCITRAQSELVFVTAPPAQTHGER